MSLTRMSIVEPDEDSARLRLRQALLRAPLFADLDTAQHGRGRARARRR